MIPILGMHRSGTSALAGALHKLGADLGSESSWLNAAADNPRGFFEYVPVVDLNNDVLAALGGTWSTPPPFPPGWVADDRLSSLHDRAAELLGEIPDRMVVKDPRMSLVEPLWEAVGDLPASVICVRHPWAVANSLRKRNQFVIDHGLFLWFRYNAAALLNSPDALVVEYESLLDDPAPVLRRVAAHIEHDVSELTIHAAAKTVTRSMAHNEAAELPDTPIGLICRSLYDLLRSGNTLDTDPAVWNWARLATELPWAGPADREITRVKREIAISNEEIDRLTKKIESLSQRSQRLETELRHALAVVDLVAIAESADLLGTLEEDIR